MAAQHPVPGADAARISRAVALTPTERHAAVEAFFAAHPGPTESAPGLGQAILDFQGWEIASGRIAEGAGSAWWAAVNGMMVLDIVASRDEQETGGAPVEAWRRYARAVNGHQQALWEAHQRSLHAAVRICAELLDREPPAEREFAAIVIDVVDRTALAGRPTNSPDLRLLTDRFYPTSYPATAELLPALATMRERTADRLRDADGAVPINIGLHSTRWD